MLNIIESIVSRFMWPCILYEVWGVYCPGCGGTRAVLALLHGNVVKSIHCHPIVVYTMVCFLWYLIKVFVKKISKGKWIIYMPKAITLLYVAAIIVIVNWLLRNLLLIKWGITLPQ